jgi:hypothetical protein
LTYFENELEQLDVDSFHGKSFQIKGPGDLRFDVDYDDVNHYEVDLLTRQMLAILNTYWITVQARVCSNEDDIDYDADNWEDREMCGLRYLPLDGPDECPVCGSALKVVTVG